MPPSADSLSDPLQSPRWVEFIDRLTQRAGMGGAVAVFSGLSVVLSVAFTAIVISALRPSALLLAVTVCFGVSLVVSASVSYFLCSIVADLVRARALLLRLVNIDVLTQAYTRRYFMDAARRLLSATRLSKEPPPSAIVLLDIDDFKRINDTHGHAAGDAVLCAVSNACRRRLCDQGLFARYGGEEFVVLLPGVSPGTALGRIDRLRRTIARLEVRTPEGERLKVTACFGIAALTPGPGSIDQSLREALAAADRALYRAKNCGKNLTLIDPVFLRPPLHGRRGDGKGNAVRPTGPGIAGAGASAAFPGGIARIVND